MAGISSLGKCSFAAGFSACLSLGFYFWWVASGHIPDLILFGEYGSWQSLHQFFLRLATGIGFLLTSFTFYSRWSQKTILVCSALLAALSTASYYWCSAFLGEVGFAVSGFLAGVAFALFFAAWLRRYTADLDALFVMLLIALTIGSTLGSGFSYYNGAIYKAAALLAPIAASLLLFFAPEWDLPCAVAEKKGPMSPAERTAFTLQVVSLLLCNVAGGPASYGALTAAGDEVRSAPLVSLALAAVLMLCLRPRKELLFPFLSVGILICIAPLLVLHNPPGWIAGLVSAGFWIVMMYSVAWFAAEGKGSGRAVSSVGLRGIATVYLLSAVSEIIGIVLPGGTAYVCALVIVGVALAVALVGATRSVASTVIVDDERTGSVQLSVGPSSPNRLLSMLAERFSLTEGERGVFEWLSRGYSLKQIAKELGITEGAAKYQRHNVYQKLGVSSRQELINLVEDAARQDGKTIQAGRS